MQARQVGRLRSHYVSIVSGTGDGLSRLVATYLCLAVDALAAREGWLVAFLLLFGRRVIVVAVIEEIAGLRHCRVGIGQHAT